MNSKTPLGSPALPLRGARAGIAMTLGLGVAMAAAGARPYPERAPLGHTGGFGEPTCMRCHAGDGINPPGGTLVLEGLPAAYEPARRYRLSMNLDRPGTRRAGFQLAIRFVGGEPSGLTAGRLRVLDERVQLEDSAGVGYAFHTSAGSGLTAPNRAVWALEWTAPGDGGRVVAHFVGNAANDDASELGDLVYADSVVSEPAR